MSDVPELPELHEMPYSEINGAYVKVHQQVTSSPMMPQKERRETREGTIAGRQKGHGLYFDSELGQNVPTTECAIFIETPEDTILEVRTDKPENELLEFEPQE